MKPEDIERVKDLLPTSLGSDEIRDQIAADILRRSVFTARMEDMRYLAKIREVTTELSVEPKAAGPLADDGPHRTLGGGLW